MDYHGELMVKQSHKRKPIICGFFVCFFFETVHSLIQLNSSFIYVLNQQPKGKLKNHYQYKITYVLTHKRKNRMRKSSAIMSCINHS